MFTELTKRTKLKKSFQHLKSKFSQNNKSSFEINFNQLSSKIKFNQDSKSPFKINFNQNSNLSLEVNFNQLSSKTNFKQNKKSSFRSKINSNRLQPKTGNKSPPSLKFNFKQSNKSSPLPKVSFSRLRSKASGKSSLLSKISSSQQQLKSNFNLTSKVNDKTTFEVNNKPTSEIKSKKVYIDIAFELNDEFIYHLDERCRLCISALCDQKIFRIIYNNNQHLDKNRCYQRIINFFYLSRLFKKLRRYIEHCLACQLNQIKRYRFYNELIFIFSFFYLFYTLILNFIVDLLDAFNVLLIVIEKLSRRIIFIFDKTTYIVEN